LSDSDRGSADVATEQSPELTRTDLEPIGQPVDIPIVKRSAFNQL
jgi:hypothetical protein